MGPSKQHIFTFTSGLKYLIRNEQPLESAYLEFLFRPLEPLTAEEVWYVELIVQHAFDSQRAVVVYSPLVMSPPSQDAKLVTPLPLSEIDSFLFVNSTLYIDVRLSDDPFSSAGAAALPGSSTASLLRPVPHVGIINLGSTGYMTSVLQALFHLPRFRLTVYALTSGCRMVRELQRLFGSLQVASKPCSTKLLTQTLQWTDLDALPGRGGAGQRDSEAFFRLILAQIRESSSDPSVCDLFTGKYATPLRSLNMDISTVQVEDFWLIPLEIRGCSSLYEAINKFVEPQLAPSDQYFGDFHLRHDPSSGFEFIELPSVLVFSLRRFDFELLHVRRDPSGEYFSFPEELDMTKYVSRATRSYVFDIFAVLVYTGYANSGHHFAYIKTAPDWQWYHFNDSVVSIATREQAIAQSFGGGSSTTAHMLIYVNRASVATVFQPCELPRKVRDFVCDVQLRTQAAAPRSPRFLRTFRLITEEDVRQHVLQGRNIRDMTNFVGQIEIDDGSSNHELYAQIATTYDRPLNMIQLWKVDDHRMPTTIIPDGPQKCPQKNMILFVQDLFEPVTVIPRSMRLAFLTIFVTAATPKVQFVGTITVNSKQPVTQVFPFLWAILEIPTVMFHVYCEAIQPLAPIPQSVALADMGLSDAVVFLFEPVVPIQTRYQFPYFKQPKDEAVSYYSKVRPQGDMTASEHLERKAGQLRIQVFRVTDPETVVTTIAAPETLPVTELPDFILFATKELFDAKRDTFQLFRHKVNDTANETLPYTLKPDVNLRMMFVSDLKRASDSSPLKLFYDILRGIPPGQLKMYVVRTCDIFDGPLHKLRRIRYAMKVTEPLTNLVQYIQSEVCPTKHPRLLRDVDGCVRPLASDELVEENSILRFDVIPPDQRSLGAGEFLVVALVCRFLKNKDTTVSLGQSFMFKIFPGETCAMAKKRLHTYKFADDRLMPWVALQARGSTIADEATLDDKLRPNEVLKVVLPDRSRTNCLLKGAKQTK
jgi:hypothetical protein